MLDNNRFFRFLWRINALAITGVALIAAVLGAYALYSILRAETRDRNVSDLLVVNPEQPVQEEVILGRPRALAGTKMVRVPLYREQKIDVSYYSKESGSNTVNELVIDSVTGKSEWLFKDTARLIVNITETRQEINSDAPKTEAIVYSMIERDSNSDGKLTATDKISIGYSNAEAANYVPLLDNIEKLYAVQQVADDRLMVIYVKDGESRLMTYMLPAFTTLADIAMPKLEASR